MLIQCGSSAFVFIRNGSFPWKVHHSFCEVFSTKWTPLWSTLSMDNKPFVSKFACSCMYHSDDVYLFYVREIYPNRILLRAVPYRSSKWKSKPSHGMNICTSSKNLKTSTHFCILWTRAKWKKGKSVWNTWWIPVLDWFKIFLIELFFISISFWFSLHFKTFFIKHFRKNPDYLSQNNGFLLLSMFHHFHTFQCSFQKNIFHVNKQINKKM